MNFEFGLARAKLAKDIESRVSLVEAQLQKRLNYLMDAISKLESTIESLEYKEALAAKHLVNEKILEFIKYSEYLIRNELSEVPFVLEEWLGTFNEFQTKIQQQEERNSKMRVNNVSLDVQQDSEAFDKQANDWCAANNNEVTKIKRVFSKNTLTALNNILQIKNGQTEQSISEWDESQLDVFLVQQQFDKLKAACITNSEKIDHNLKILKKQEEENSKILNSIKRKQTQHSDNLSELNDTRVLLDSHLIAIQQLRVIKNDKLELKIKHAVIQYNAIKSKAERDFDSLWELKDKQIAGLLADIRVLNDAVSSNELSAVTVNDFKSIIPLQGFDSTHQLQLTDITSKILSTMSSRDKCLIKEIVSNCKNIVPAEIINATISEDDLFIMQTEYLLKFFKVSSIPQYLDLKDAIKRKSEFQTYPELVTQISKSIIEKTNDYAEYWESCIPKSKDIKLLNYDINYKFRNFQSSQSLIKEIELLLKDQEFLTNALK